MALIDSFYTWEDTIMFRTSHTLLIDTHTRIPLCLNRHKFTHSHSTMLLSHSPWSHFSQSPGVCEGQSGLSSHKAPLHSRLPMKVCLYQVKHWQKNQKQNNEKKEKQKQKIWKNNDVQECASSEGAAAQFVWAIESFSFFLFSQKRHQQIRGLSVLKPVVLLFFCPRMFHKFHSPYIVFYNKGFVLALVVVQGSWNKIGLVGWLIDMTFKLQLYLFFLNTRKCCPFTKKDTSDKIYSKNNKRQWTLDYKQTDEILLKITFNQLLL